MSRKLLKASPRGQVQLFPEALERDPLQLTLDPRERERIRAAEAARGKRAAQMDLTDMFAPRKK